MEFIYEVSLSGRVITLQFNVWEKIRDYVRSGKWFVISYMGSRYRYVSDRTYCDRPTRFNFELSSEEDEVIEIIYI